MKQDDFRIGFLLGVLVGEGHFGGDGKQPQITLRMHTDHERLFHWLEESFPGGRLYGPYHHGGRSYFQWMARGSFLTDDLVPLLDRHLRPELDEKTYRRYCEMKERYGLASAARVAPAAPAALADSDDADDAVTVDPDPKV